MTRHLQVAQDSAAVILFNQTPPEIQGFYTTGLQSCVAIFAKGDQGLALVHDGGKLTEQSVAEVFARIGPIDFWGTAFYPDADREYQRLHPKEYVTQYQNKGMFQEKFSRILAIMTRVLQKDTLSKYRTPENEKYYPAEDRSFSIDRFGPKPPEAILKEPNFPLRFALNELNSACMAENEQFPCDLQYDGVKFTPMPRLAYSESEIQKFCAVDEYIQLFFDNYIRFKTILSTYKVDSLEQALRRAAHQGNYEHITYLAKKGVDVNARDEKQQKSPLYWAMKQQHPLAISILVGFGATP